MLEKVITLENVSLVDFLGVQNENIKELATAFPDRKIISSGNEIRIQGTAPQIIKINDILNSLIAHYNKYGKVSHDNVLNYIKQDHEESEIHAKDEILIYGTREIGRAHV